MKLKLFTLAVAAVVLSACDSDTSMHAAYNCEYNKTLDATFTNGEKVTIDYNDETHTLNRVKDGTNTVRYEADGMTFVSLGREAKLSEKGHPPLKCRRR